MKLRGPNSPQSEPVINHTIALTRLLTQSSLMTQRKHLLSLTSLCANGSPGEAISHPFSS